MSSFQDRMAAGKAKALDARNEGGSTVRVFATTKAMYGELEAGCTRTDSQCRWEYAVSDFIEGLWFDLRGHEWGDFA